jgi:HlyD family secretion protein
MTATRFPLPRAIAIAAVTLVVAACSDTPAHVSGTVEAQRVIVSAQSSGTLLELNTVEGATVEAGDVLARIDCAQPQATLAQATAARAAADAQAALANAQQATVLNAVRPQELEIAQADVRAAQQALAMATDGARTEEREQIDAAIEGIGARLELAETTHTRMIALVDAGAATQSQLDEATAGLDALRSERTRLLAQRSQAQQGGRPEEIRVLRERVRQAQARMSLLEEGARTSERDAATAQVAAARAQADAAAAQASVAQIAVDRCTVSAPVAGTIDIAAYDAGELVGAGAPLFAIATDQPLIVNTWVPQTMMADLRPGAEVTVYVDGRPDEPVSGIVRHVDSEAEFTAGNVQTPDDRMLLVHRVELVLPADTASIRPGMTVVVAMDQISSPRAGAVATPGSEGSR